MWCAYQAGLFVEQLRLVADYACEHMLTTLMSAVPLASAGLIAKTVFGHRRTKLQSGLEAAAPMAAAALTDSYVLSSPLATSMDAAIAWGTRVAVSSLWAGAAYLLSM